LEKNNVAVVIINAIVVVDNNNELASSGHSPGVSSSLNTQRQIKFRGFKIETSIHYTYTSPIDFEQIKMSNRLDSDVQPHLYPVAQ
jgi:hypothetical protein